MGMEKGPRAGGDPGGSVCGDLSCAQAHLTPLPWAQCQTLPGALHPRTLPWAEASSWAPEAWVGYQCELSETGRNSRSHHSVGSRKVERSQSSSAQWVTKVWALCSPQQHHPACSKGSGSVHIAHQRLVPHSGGLLLKITAICSYLGLLQGVWLGFTVSPSLGSGVEDAGPSEGPHFITSLSPAVNPAAVSRS